MAEKSVIPVTISNSRSDASSHIRDIGRRPAEPTFPVWAPDGHMEMHTRANINDLTRLGTRGPDGLLQLWSRTSPDATGPTEQAPSAAGGEQVVSELEDATGGADDRPATPKLDALRHELVTLGGQADPKWGIKSLNREIAKRREAATAGNPLPGPVHLQDDAGGE